MGLAFRHSMPRGVLMSLRDLGPIPYSSGLMRRREGTPDMKAGDRLFVKVVRIEMEQVIVDSRQVDAKTGADLDPANDHAEVEDWVDVPEGLAGAII
ncbi:unnamed protein product, partial [Prorocentrum cordatum]